jgi:hypothetical protein
MGTHSGPSRPVRPELGSRQAATWMYRAKLRAGWEMGEVGNAPGLSGKRAKREVGSVGSGLLAGSVAVQMPMAPG